jgi:hypothetical protein
MPFERNDPRINRNGRPQGSANTLSKNIRQMADKLLLDIDTDSLHQRDKIKLLEVLLRYSIKHVHSKSIFNEDLTLKDTITFEFS